ncbi:MAG: peroxiredoxin [Alphaproteobacteria bacterium]|nr:peroxiredoxin [Alphaproteobacteria bacterium]
MLQEGDAMPDFSAPTDGDGALTAADLKGAPAVIYFYPKDDTPGCTTEAKDFTDMAADFAALGVKVVGVSKDTVAKHDKFKAKHDLSLILASDADGGMCEAFGAWGVKKMYGKEYEGIIRSTFLIDAGGSVAKVWPKVKVKGHAAEVLEAAKAL